MPVAERGVLVFLNSSVEPLDEFISVSGEVGYEATSRTKREEISLNMEA